MRRFALSITTVLALAIVCTSSASRATHVPQSKQYSWMPSMWYRLAVCESGSNPPNWRHHTYYQGAFGFAPGAWDQFRYHSMPSEAYLASPQQQYRVALRVFHRYGYSPWGCFDHSWVRYG